MTDSERSSFSPLTKRNTIIRPHSPYSEASGPILKEGTVAARIQALHKAQNSQAPRNTAIISRLRSRSNKVTSPSTGSIAQGDDNRSTYVRRKSLTFAPPASRNASVAGQHYVPPTRYTPQSGVLPGPGADTSVERVGNKFVLVRAKTLPQHDVPNPWAVLPPRQADPEESDGLSPGTKPEERYRLAVLESVDGDEASTEHREVLKKDSIADVLGVMIDKAIYDHESAIEWSSDGSNPDTHEYRHEALSELNSSPGSSTPLGSPIRGSTSPDNRSIAAIKYSSASSGSDLSKRHRRRRKTKPHRKFITTEETTSPRSSFDAEGYPAEDASSRDATAESDTPAQGHISHHEAASSSPPAFISQRSAPQNLHPHHPRQRNPPPAQPAKTNPPKAQAASRPRPIRRHQKSSISQPRRQPSPRNPAAPTPATPPLQPAAPPPPAPPTALPPPPPPPTPNPPLLSTPPPNPSSHSPPPLPTTSLLIPHHPRPTSPFPTDPPARPRTWCWRFALVYPAAGGRRDVVVKKWAGEGRTPEAEAGAAGRGAEEVIELACLVPRGGYVEEGGEGGGGKGLGVEGGGDAEGWGGERGDGEGMGGVRVVVRVEGGGDVVVEARVRGGVGRREAGEGGEG